MPRRPRVRFTSAARRRCAFAEPLEPRRLLAAIASDQTLAGTISSPTEIDEYTFDANAGDSIIASIAETATSGFDPGVELLAPDGTSLVFDYGGVGADLFANPLPQTGTYTLRTYDNGQDETGSYEITLAHLPGAQSPNDGDGGALVSGGRVDASIALGDLDVYTFQADAGDSTILSVNERNGNTSFETYLLVYGPDGTFLFSDSGGDGADLFHTAAAGGTYYVVVKDVYADSGDDTDVEAGDYSLRMIQLPGAQSSDDGDGGTLTSGGRVDATIDLGDLDVFTFQADAGDNTILSVNERNGNTSFEPWMLVYGPDGAFISSDSGGVGTDVFHTAATGGTYYVVIKDVYADSGDDTDVEAGDYSLRMAQLPGAQASDDGDGGTLTSGGRVDATSALGDLDVYTFQADAGDSTILSVNERNGNTSFETYLLVYGPDGAFVTSDSGDVGADLFVNAATGGTYYVVIKDLYADSGDDTDVEAGDYTLRMVQLPGAQQSDDGDGGALTSGERVDATLDLGDLDVYTFTANAGDTFLGVISDLDASAPYDIQGLVYGPGGSFLGSTDGSPDDSAIGFTNLTQSGTYYVVVKDVYADSGDDTDVEAGEYAMTFVIAPDPQPTDADSGPIASGQVRAGAISRGDIDVYTFPIDAGNGFTVNLAETATSGFDPQLWIVNPAGDIIFSDVDASGVSASISNPALSGFYTAIVFDSGGGESGPYTIALNAATGADTFAPRVLDAEYRYDDPNAALRVIFSEDVGASFSFSDVTIVNTDTNQPVDPSGFSTSYTPGGDFFTVTFPGLTNRVLPNGNYELRINRNDLVDAAGNPLTQNIAFDFYTLAGDANRDRVVSLADFLILRSNFGKIGQVFSNGDFNYDGTVSLADFLILRANFGVDLPPPPSAAPLAGLFAEGGLDEEDDAAVALLR